MPNEGMMILKLQVRLMAFLVDFCHQILHEIPLETMTSDKYPVLPEPSLPTDVDASCYPSLAVMAAEAPYPRLSKLNMEHIAASLDAHKLSAEDHIWSLCEDPAYFANQLLEIKDHRQESVPDFNGQLHPITDRLNEHILWGRVTHAMIADAYYDFEFANELLRQAVELTAWQKTYENKIKPTDDLPVDYLSSLIRFKYFLEVAVKNQCQKLKKDVHASPPFRRLFVREPTLDRKSTEISVVFREGAKWDSIEKQVLWFLEMMCWEDEETRITNLYLLVDELERLLESEPKADALISAHNAKRIGNLAILVQCLKQLERCQPWAQQFDLLKRLNERDLLTESSVLENPVTRRKRSY
jgi:hypothetical protein